MSLYTDLIEAGCEVGSWQSDLYAVKTSDAIELFKRHNQKLDTFKGSDGRLWLEAPFMFDPFWESRQ